MHILSASCCLRITSCSLPRLASSEIKGIRGRINALAGQKQTKRIKKPGRLQKGDKTSPLVDENDGPNSELSNFNYVEDKKENSKSSLDYSKFQSSIIVPSRGAVLQACIVTSGFIGALGVLIRQVSHVASAEGWSVIDCSTDITFSFEPWHLELVAGSVLLVSSCRFLLLKLWHDFAESSEAANQQVLTSLEPQDYLVVAFLPGISEELLFRGALLPLFGIIDDWIGVTFVAALFGVLHLGSGRKYSFAIWATFVGIVYGYATIMSSSIVVPMISHALNNLVGGLAWRYASNSSKQIEE